jgi:hypothetical protein
MDAHEIERFIHRTILDAGDQCRPVTARGSVTDDRA